MVLEVLCAVCCCVWWCRLCGLWLSLARGGVYGCVCFISSHTTTMSSGSASPFPSADIKSLSNDALYAPLSTYDGGISTTSCKEKNHHSLTLQTSSSLRESSLLSFLSNTCQNLKTSHPYESIVYRSVCGSITKYGMGDNDNSNEMTKTFFENKLSNRSLVLVGGGVHSHAAKEDDGVVTSVIQSASAAISGKKRERKRVGGNGMFGSLSKRKRKKILKRNALHKSPEKSFAEPNEEIIDEIRQTKMISSSTQSTAGDINKVIESIHKMWIEYMAKLLLHVKPVTKCAESNKAPPKSSMTPQIHQQITALLLEAEHVGMAATIIQCPSRALVDCFVRGTGM